MGGSATAQSSSPPPDNSGRPLDAGGEGGLLKSASGGDSVSGIAKSGPDGLCELGSDATEEATDSVGLHGGLAGLTGGGSSSSSSPPPPLSHHAGHATSEVPLQSAFTAAAEEPVDSGDSSPSPPESPSAGLVGREESFLDTLRRRLNMRPADTPKSEAPPLSVDQGEEELEPAPTPGARSSSWPLLTRREETQDALQAAAARGASPDDRPTDSACAEMESEDQMRRNESLDEEEGGDNDPFDDFMAEYVERALTGINDWFWSDSYSRKERASGREELTS